MTGLIEECLNLIAKHSTKVLGSEEFNALPVSFLKAIFSRDDLRCIEQDVWNAFDCWQQVSGGNTSEIAELVPCIRYPVLNSDFFQKKVEPSKLLSPYMLVDVYRYLSSPASAKPSTMFNKSPRIGHVAASELTTCPNQHPLDWKNWNQNATDKTCRCNFCGELNVKISLGCSDCEYNVCKRCVFTKAPKESRRKSSFRSQPSLYVFGCGVGEANGTYQIGEKHGGADTYHREARDDAEYMLYWNHNRFWALVHVGEDGARRGLYYVNCNKEVPPEDGWICHNSGRPPTPTVIMSLSSSFPLSAQSQTC